MTFKDPRRPACDEVGPLLSELRAGELAPAEREALIAGARRVGLALHEAGYFGPYGVDAFRWRDELDRPQLHALSEVNARYTMGWTAPAL